MHAVKPTAVLVRRVMHLRALEVDIRAGFAGAAEAAAHSAFATTCAVRRRRHGRGCVMLIESCCAHALAVKKADKRADTLLPPVDDARALSKVTTATTLTATKARMQEAVGASNERQRRAAVVTGTAKAPSARVSACPKSAVVSASAERNAKVEACDLKARWMTQVVNAKGCDSSEHLDKTVEETGTKSSMHNWCMHTRMYMAESTHDDSTIVAS
eukprot:2515320-Pleurochrysis_carterae.AAC.2